MQFSSAVTIDAPIEKVWGILSDVGKYASWESGVTKVEGTGSLGSTIKLYSEVSPGRAFPLKVIEFEPNRIMTFVGGMPLGLFTGTRTYVVSDTGKGTRFEMTEIYTGPMAAMITRSIPDLNPSFQKFAAGLKEQSEKR